MRVASGARWAVVAGVALCAAAVGPVAAAAPPSVAPVPFEQTFPGYTGVCEFPITVTFDTHQTVREWYDERGALVRSQTTGPGSVTIGNDDSGKSVTVSASGPTVNRHGRSVGTGSWVLIGRQANAAVLPFAPGAWLYRGRIADLDAADYSDVFRGRVVDLCAAVS
jgi:hypothetical protein